MDKKKRICLVIAIGAILILVSSTIVRCTLVHQDDSQEQTVPAESSDEKTKPIEDAAQQAVSTDSTDALSVLKGSIWTAEEGKTTLTFKDGRYIESKGSELNTTTFDVVSVTKEASQTSITLKLDTASGASKDSIVLLRQDASGMYSISSDDFLFVTTYRQGQPNQSPLALEGINDEFRELLGGSTDALGKAVSDYAHTHVLTATVATWDKVLVVDYAQNTVCTNFTCNDTAKTVLSVEYARTSATYTVMG